MGKKGGQKQTQNSQTGPDQFYLGQGRNNYEQAAQAINNWNPTLQQAPAGFTDDQNTVMSTLRANPTGNARSLGALDNSNALLTRMSNFSAPEVQAYSYDPYTTSDERMAQLMSPVSKYKFTDPGAMGFGGPLSAVGAGSYGGGAVGAANVEAANIDRSAIRDIAGRDSRQELQSYIDAFDPAFAQGVLDPALHDLDRQRQILQQGNKDAAARAGAFGGSRHGVVEAETNRGYLDAAARTAGDLRMGMLDRALSTMSGDFGRSLQADQANQGQDWNVAGQNATLQQQASIQNAQNAMRAAEANQQAAAQQAAAQNAMNSQYQQLLAQAALMNENNRAQFATQMMNAGFGVEGSNMAALNKAGEYGATAKNNASATNAANAINTANTVWNNAATGFQNQATAEDALYGTNLDRLWRSGEAQRQYKQSVLDTDFNNATAQNTAPLIRAGMLQQALGATPYTTMSNGTSEVQNQAGWGNLLGSAAGVLLSDKRAKKNVKKMKGSPLNSIGKMQGVTYNWKGDGRPDAGLIAQDVDRAIPNGGSPVINGMHHVSVPHVLGLLTEGIKELDRRTSGKKDKKRAA